MFCNVFQGNMNTLWIVGSSHGVRIGKELKKIVIPAADAFEIKNLSKRGARYEQLNWPNPDQVGVNDVILVIPFGNNLVKRGSVKRENGIWHLTDYQPESETRLQTLAENLKGKCTKYTCKVFIVTNFYRLFCCNLHIHPGWLVFQKKFNISLENRFKRLNNPNIRVLDHRYLVDGTSGGKQAKRSVHYYMSLQYDSVHFRDYHCIANSILMEIAP